MPLREPFNAVSHMVGAGLALALVPLLVLDASGALAVVAASVYGACLVAVFVLSAVFHGVTHEGAVPWLFRVDQAAIYFLIAGTYTPLALLLVGGAAGWAIFGLQWGMALAGAFVLLALHRTPPWVHQAAYILLGWTAVLALPQVDGLQSTAWLLVVGGGVCYTGGAVLYWRDRAGTWAVGDHGLWHLLVIAGSGLHAAFVLAYIL